MCTRGWLGGFARGAAGGLTLRGSTGAGGAVTRGWLGGFTLGAGGGLTVRGCTGAGGVVIRGWLGGLTFGAGGGATLRDCTAGFTFTRGNDFGPCEFLFSAPPGSGVEITRGGLDELEFVVEGRVAPRTLPLSTPTLGRSRATVGTFRTLASLEGASLFPTVEAKADSVRLRVFARSRTRSMLAFCTAS